MNSQPFAVTAGADEVPTMPKPLLLLLFLFRHSANSFNAQKERLVTSPQLVTILQLPLAIVVRLHVRKVNVVILTPETAVSIGV